MKRLFTINRDHNLDLKGTMIKRQACRAIIFYKGRLLLVQSKKFGDLKFPGGGINQGETPYQALFREVKEETGYLLNSKISPFGSVQEFGRDIEGKYAIFCQESFYYFCEIEGPQGDLALDDYEREYGYEPLFTTIGEAIRNNENIPKNGHIPWKERDTLVMKILEEEIAKKKTDNR